MSSLMEEKISQKDQLNENLQTKEIKNKLKELLKKRLLANEENKENSDEEKTSENSQKEVKEIIKEYSKKSKFNKSENLEITPNKKVVSGESIEYTKDSNLQRSTNLKEKRTGRVNIFSQIDKTRFQKNVKDKCKDYLEESKIDESENSEIIPNKKILTIESILFLNDSRKSPNDLEELTGQVNYFSQKDKIRFEKEVTEKFKTYLMGNKMNENVEIIDNKEVVTEESTVSDSLESFKKLQEGGTHVIHFIKKNFPSYEGDFLYF